MYENTECTLYLYSSGYKKVTVPCFITKRSPYVTSRMGLSYTEVAFCMIDKTNLPSGTAFTEGKDFLIIAANEMGLMPNTGLYPGDKLYPMGELSDMYGKTEKELSDAIRLLVKRGATTVMTAEFKNYGSQRMRHWELSCR